jgi:hypothetical protein
LSTDAIIRDMPSLRRAIALVPGRHQGVVLNDLRQGHLVDSLDHHRGGGGGIEPVLQPAHPRVGYRRHEDQHFGDHDEQDGEPQKL